jgi:hypothetical protein
MEGLRDAVVHDVSFSGFTMEGLQDAVVHDVWSLR